METKLCELSNFKMSFNLMPPTLLSSQQSDLGDDDLVKMIEASESTSTKRTTSWGFMRKLRKLRKWLDKINIQLDVKSVTEEKLCDTLKKFYAEVKSEKRYVNTARPSWAATHRALRASPYNRNFNIIADRSFTAINQIFTVHCKLYYKTTETVDYTNHHVVATNQSLQSLMANANFHNRTFNFHKFSGQSGHQ